MIKSFLFIDENFFVWITSGEREGFRGIVRDNLECKIWVEIEETQYCLLGLNKAIYLTSYVVYFLNIMKYITYKNVNNAHVQVVKG